MVQRNSRPRILLLFGGDGSGGGEFLRQGLILAYIGFQFIMQTKLATTLWQSFGFYLLRAGIRRMSYCAQLKALYKTYMRKAWETQSRLSQHPPSYSIPSKTANAIAQQPHP